VRDICCARPSTSRSISAEHGLGQAKREEILRYKSPFELELMRAIKRTLGSLGIMNPGKVLEHCSTPNIKEFQAGGLLMSGYSDR